MRNASGFRLPPTAADIFSFAAEEATGRPPSASAKRLAIDPPFSRDRIETGREWIERQVSEFLNISTSSISKSFVAFVSSKGQQELWINLFWKLIAMDSTISIKIPNAVDALRWREGISNRDSQRGVINARVILGIDKFNATLGTAVS